MNISHEFECHTLTTPEGSNVLALLANNHWQTPTHQIKSETR
ncbi:MAG: hypothetical protein ACI9UN_000712 [Granulosicoccus sp.]|jgi:hypothetical protein